MIWFAKEVIRRVEAIADRDPQQKKTFFSKSVSQSMIAKSNLAKLEKTEKALIVKALNQ